MIHSKKYHTSTIVNSMRVERHDGYSNTLSGLGVGGRSGANQFDPSDPITEVQLKALYDDNWLARRIVEAIPSQAMRRPLVMDQDALVAFNRVNNNPRYPNGVLKHGLNMGRLCGGAVIILGMVGTGAPLEAPLPVDADGVPQAGEVAFLEVLTKFDLESKQQYDLPDEPLKHKKTELFKVKSGPLKDLLIHESRMIFCEGGVKARLTDSQADVDFPWQSVLQPVNEVLGNYGISWTSVAHLIQESSMAWLRLKGLVDMLSSEDKGAVDERMNLLSTGRNVAKTIFLDAGDGDGNGEEFGRTAVSFSDLPALLEQLTLTVSGATEIPVAILMGQSPAGLSATGESDMRQFYDRIQEYRTSAIDPKLRVLFRVGGQKDVAYEWPQLWEPTAAQAAEIRTKQLQGDQLLFTMGVVDPDHILESRSRDKSLGIVFDWEKLLRERAASKTGPTIEVTPTDNAKVITFNELRANQGKPPITLPGTNTPDPDGDLPLFIYELKKTKELEALYAPAVATASGPGSETTPGADPQDGQPGASGGAPFAG